MLHPFLLLWIFLAGLIAYDDLAWLLCMQPFLFLRIFFLAGLSFTSVEDAAFVSLLCPRALEIRAADLVLGDRASRC